MPRKQIAFYLDEETKARLDLYRTALGASQQALLEQLIKDVLAEPEAVELLAKTASTASTKSLALNR